MATKRACPKVSGLHPDGVIQRLTTTCLQKRVGIVLLVITASCARFTPDSNRDQRVGYDIRVDPNSHSILRVKIRFQPPLESMTEWIVRGSQWAQQMQVPEVRTDAPHISADQKGHWRVPPHTKRLSWKVVLRDGTG